MILARVPARPTANSKSPPALPAQLEVRRILLATTAAPDASGSLALALHGGQFSLSARSVTAVLEPHLWLRDVGRHVAHNALDVLVEHPRRYARALQPMQHEISIETVKRSVEAFHGRRRGPVQFSHRTTSPSGTMPTQGFAPMA